MRAIPTPEAALENDIPLQLGMEAQKFIPKFILHCFAPPTFIFMFVLCYFYVCFVFIVCLFQESFVALAGLVLVSIYLRFFLLLFI